MCKRLATPLIQGLGTLIYCESQNYYFLSEHENVQFKSIKEGTVSSSQRTNGIKESPQTASLCFCLVVVLVVVLVCVREHRGICVCKGQRSRRNFLFFFLLFSLERRGWSHFGADGAGVGVEFRRPTSLRLPQQGASDRRQRHRQRLVVIVRGHVGDALATVAHFICSADVKRRVVG